MELCSVHPALNTERYVEEEPLSYRISQVRLASWPLAETKTIFLPSDCSKYQSLLFRMILETMRDELE